jgi:hypothetical protein
MKREPGKARRVDLCGFFLQSEWIVVGYWGGTRTFDKLLVHLRAAVASYITTSPLEARTQIQALLPSVEFV